MIDVRNFVEEKINKLWKDYKEESFCQFPPNSIASVPQNGLIFIGINPSMNSKDEKILTELNDIKCDFNNLTSDKTDNHRYFRKFYAIAENTHLPWGHLDLLYVRETKQNKVKELLKTEKGSDFIIQQLRITKPIIDSLINPSTPNIFIVNNTMARHLLTESKIKNLKSKQDYSMGYNFEWSDVYGTHVCHGNPFFFTSMLTGQRALDNGSFERLIWHINLVQEKLKKKS